MTRWPVQQISVGTLTATVLPLGEVSDTLRSWFRADALAIPDGVSRLPVNSLHVAGVGMSVLIDACDPGLYPDAGPPGGPGERLEAAGVDPAGITHVIVTHGHHDHFCGVLTPSGGAAFPRARHILSPLDWGNGILTAEAQMADGNVADPSVLERLFRFGLLDLDETPVPLPPEITLIDTPGETKGHRVVRIASGIGVLYFLSDLFHVMAEIDDPNLCPIWADETTLKASRSLIMAAIRRDKARFVCSHLPDVFTAPVFPKASR
jgi:glyoxylase-like metal-dependent hydrolase (beta-lactamase superfamily II)